MNNEQQKARPCLEAVMRPINPVLLFDCPKCHEKAHSTPDGYSECCGVRLFFEQLYEAAPLAPLTLAPANDESAECWQAAIRYADARFNDITINP